MMDLSLKDCKELEEHKRDGDAISPITEKINIKNKNRKNVSVPLTPSIHYDTTSDKNRNSKNGRVIYPKSTLTGS